MSNPVEEFLQLEKKGSWQDVAGRAGAAGATIAAGLLANEAYSAIKGAIGRSRGFKAMMNYNPKLEKQDRTRVQTIYNTLYNASPDLAKDPLVANSWVNRMMYQEEYVDPKTMSDLTASQKNIAQAAARGPDFVKMFQDANLAGTSRSGGGMSPTFNINMPPRAGRVRDGGQGGQGGGRKGARQAFGG